MSTSDLTRFLILLAGPDHFSRWDAADDAAQEKIFADFRAFTAAVRERGRFRGGEALAHPKDTRTLRPDGDGRRVTEGPYAETKDR